MGGGGKIMAGRVWSWMLTRFSNARSELLSTIIFIILWDFFIFYQVK